MGAARAPASRYRCHPAARHQPYWGVGRTLPSARGTLHLVAAWYVWGFVRDNLCDESDLGTNPATLRLAVAWSQLALAI